MNHFLKIELFGKGCKVICIRIHIIDLPRLRGTAMSSPVMCNHWKALLAKKEHLCIPVIRTQRPSMAENYGLTRSPIFIIQRATIFCSNYRHTFFSFFMNHAQVVLIFIIPGIGGDNTIFMSTRFKDFIQIEAQASGYLT